MLAKVGERVAWKYGSRTGECGTVIRVEDVFQRGSLRPIKTVVTVKWDSEDKSCRRFPWIGGLTEFRSFFRKAKR